MGDPSWLPLICKDLNAVPQNAIRPRAILEVQDLCCNLPFLLRKFDHADFDLLSPLYAATRAQVT